MPKKTKEQDNTIENIKNYLLTPIKINKKDSKNVQEKKSTKKETTSATKTKSNTQSVKVSPTKKVSKNSKKTNSTTKKSIAKKNITKKISTKKTEKESSLKSLTNIKTFSPEYYDLPYKYNKTIVKILAQTPTNLFVYWEISNEDIQKLKNQYGKYFFEITKPVLVIHNITKNYSFEIDINDFANSWYFNVNDSDCEYQVELGRRPIPVNYNYIPEYNLEKNGPIEPINKPYIYISSSNNLEAPNDHILFNNTNKICFRNVKTNQITEKDIKDFPFIIQDNKFVNVYGIYKKLYKNEIFNDKFDRMNPSSGGNPSSGNLSSW